MPEIHDRIQDRFIRESEVKMMTGLSRTTRWRLERTGDFPKRRVLSPHSVGWLASEVDAWMQARIAADAA